MGYPDKKELPAGAKTYIHKWLTEQLYDRTKVFTSKYTDKGNSMEEDAINYLASYYGWGLVSKNDEFFQNDVMMGTPDLVLASLVPDIKNSWDCFTFPLFGKLDAGYEWQMNGYTELTGKDNGAVIYTLMDAPDEMVEREARSLSFQAGYSELDEEFYEQVKMSMTYSNLPEELRIKRFDIQKDAKKIQQIEDRVKLCREYIASFNLSSFKTKHLKAA